MSGSVYSDEPPRLARESITLEAVVPDEIKFNTLRSFIVDKPYRIMNYDQNTEMFDDLFFQVRTEKSFDDPSLEYVMTQTFNHFSCYERNSNTDENGVVTETTTSDSSEMKINVNGMKMEDGKIELKGDELWKKGGQSFYSDAIVGLSNSKKIKASKKAKFCTGMVSLMVHTKIGHD